MNAGRAVEPEQQTTEEIVAAMADALNSGVQSVAAAALAREMSAMSDAATATLRLERWEAASSGPE